MGKVTLRNGHDVWHFAYVADAARYKAELASLLPSQAVAAGGNVQPKCSRVILDTTRDAAQLLLDDMVGSTAVGLAGKAVSCFGTALRTKPIRQLFDGESVRELALCKVLGYVAADADAERHLTIPLIHEATALARSCLANGAATSACGSTLDESRISDEVDSSGDGSLDDGWTAWFADKSPSSGEGHPGPSGLFSSPKAETGESPESLGSGEGHPGPSGSFGSPQAETGESPESLGSGEGHPGPSGSGEMLLIVRRHKKMLLLV